MNTATTTNTEAEFWTVIFESAEFQNQVSKYENIPGGNLTFEGHVNNLSLFWRCAGMETILKRLHEGIPIEFDEWGNLLASEVWTEEDF